MKQTTSVTIAILWTLASTHAKETTIHFELSRGSGQSVLVDDAGTVTNSILTTGTRGNPQTSRYIITGLTLDSIGVGDDSISFDLILTGTGTGKITGIASAHEAWGVNDDDGLDSLVDPDESITYSFGGATVTLGSGSKEKALIQFDGFTGFRALNVDPRETYNITGTASSNVMKVHPKLGDFNKLAGGFETSFTIAGNTGAMRYYHIGSSITITTTFSKSSSGTLFSIGGVSVLLPQK